MFWCWADRNLIFDITTRIKLRLFFWQCLVSYRGIKAGWCLKSHVTLEQGLAETATVETQPAEEACWMTEESYSDFSEDYNLRDDRHMWTAQAVSYTEASAILKKDTGYCQQQQQTTECIVHHECHFMVLTLWCECCYNAVTALGKYSSWMRCRVFYLIVPVTLW